MTLSLQRVQGIPARDRFIVTHILVDGK